MKKLILTCISLAMMGCISSCQSNEDPDGFPGSSSQYGEFKRIELNEPQTEMVSASNRFALDFFKAVDARSDGGSKYAVSPYSCFVGLSMLANGDDGDTSREIMEVLTGDNDFTVDDINAFNGLMMREVPALDCTTDFVLANSLWGRKNDSFCKPFQSVIENQYDGDCFARDLWTDATRKEINQWCSDHTKGLIPEYLTENLSEDVYFALFNAVYFKGRWRDAFDKANTFKSTFYGKEEQKVDFMNKMSIYPYSCSERAESVELPFGSGNFCMHVILPEEGADIDEFVKTSTYDEWEELCGRRRSCKSCKVSISLPKFKIATKRSLIDPLKDMGVSKAFSKDYGFTSIVDNPLNTFLSAVDTEVKVTVDESGAEAAAVTSFEGDLASSAGPLDNVALNFNRPFIFVIKEKSTDTILFIGKVASV